MWLARARGEALRVRRGEYDGRGTGGDAARHCRQALRRSFFVATQGLVARLREVKDADEIVKMRRAAALGCRLFEGVLTNLSAGRRRTRLRWRWSSRRGARARRR